jgi:hypothetical protein
VLRILVTMVGRLVLCMLITIKVSTAHACDVETARYFLFIYGLIKWAVRKVSCMTSNVRSITEI